MAWESVKKESLWEVQYFNDHGRYSLEYPARAGPFDKVPVSMSRKSYAIVRSVDHETLRRDVRTGPQFIVLLENDELLRAITLIREREGARYSEQFSFDYDQPSGYCRQGGCGIMSPNWPLNRGVVITPESRPLFHELGELRPGARKSIDACVGVLSIPAPGYDGSAGLTFMTSERSR